MIHVLVVTHGGMAEGMKSSVKMLTGEIGGADFITFGEDMGADELKEELDKKITGVSEEKQYLIMCDIKGGTPFNVASRYSYKNDNVAVFYGVNLPVLIETLMGMEGQDLKQLTKYLKEISISTLGVSEL